MPLHPATVHFPIALLAVSGGFYLYHFWKKEVFFQRSAFHLHLIGLASMLLAVLTGNIASGEVELAGPLKEVFQQHQIIGYLLLWYLSMLLIWHYLRGKRFSRWEHLLFILLFVGGLGLMTYSAHLGGSMVYEYGAGLMDGGK